MMPPQQSAEDVEENKCSRVKRSRRSPV